MVFTQTTGATPFNGCRARYHLRESLCTFGLFIAHLFVGDVVCYGQP